MRLDHLLSKESVERTCSGNRFGSEQGVETRAEMILFNFEGLEREPQKEERDRNAKGVGV